MTAAWHVITPRRVAATGERPGNFGKTRSDFVRTRSDLNFPRSDLVFPRRRLVFPRRRPRFPTSHCSAVTVGHCEPWAYRPDQARGYYTPMRSTMLPSAPATALKGNPPWMPMAAMADKC